MPPLPLRDPGDGRLLDASPGRSSRIEAEELAATLRALGYVVYRKRPRRRGNVLTYLTDAGDAVRLEQLEVPPT